MSDCKEQIWGNYRHVGCSRKAVVDGYCKQHHPDNVNKRREESDRKWNEKQARTPLAVAKKNIESLEKRVKELEQEVLMSGKHLKRVQAENETWQEAWTKKLAEFKSLEEFKSYADYVIGLVKQTPLDDFYKEGIHNKVTWYFCSCNECKIRRSDYFKTKTDNRES
jgi:hypothetical protein